MKGRGRIAVANKAIDWRLATRIGVTLRSWSMGEDAALSMRRGGFESVSAVTSSFRRPEADLESRATGLPRAIQITPASD